MTCQKKTVFPPDQEALLASGSFRRRELMGQLWDAAAEITPEDYLAFLEHCGSRRLPEDSEVYQKTPFWRFYDLAFERVLAGISGCAPQENETVLFLLYNMGYVVRTSKVCFGVDLHHRLAEHLAEKLDFLCITHFHDDHYDMKLLNALDAQNKMIISNFFPSAGYSKHKKEHLCPGNVRVIAHESDHNVRLAGFTAPMEIILPDSRVLFFGGDSYRADQLIPDSGPADCFVLHPYVGLAPDEAVQAVRPRLTLVSHLLELHHPADRWRWSYEDGLRAAEKITAAGYRAYIPLWGEQIVLNS